MTIQTQTPRVVVIGNGTLGPYSLVDSGSQAIRFVSTSHVKLTRYSSVTAETGTVLTLNTDYTVGGTQDARTFTLIGSQVALTTSQRIVAERNQTYVQDLNLTTGGAFNAESVETRFDKVAEYLQELRAKVDRKLEASQLDSTPSTIPLKANATAGNVLGYDSSKNLVPLALASLDVAAVDPQWLAVLADDPLADQPELLLSDYSALKTGSDWTASISAIVTASQALGGAPMYFNVTGTIDCDLLYFTGLVYPVLIRGPGMDVLTIRAISGVGEAAFGASQMLSFTGSPHFQLTDIGLDGDNVLTTNTETFLCAAINCSKVTIERVKVRNFKRHGIAFAGSLNGVVRDCDIRRGSHDGARSYQSSGLNWYYTTNINWIVENNYIESTEIFFAGKDARISNNIVESPGVGAGIVSNNGDERVNVVGNTVRNSIGIDLYEVWVSGIEHYAIDGVISQNVCHNNSGNGIVFGGQRTDVHDNTCYNNGPIALTACRVATVPGAVFNATVAGTTLTVTSVTSGTLAVGQTLTHGYLTNGVTITGLGTGSGGTGTYTLSATQATNTCNTVTASNPAYTFASSFENGDTVDGIVLATNDRILIKDMADQTTNGVYVVQASGSPVRATDANAASELLRAWAKVTAGTVNATTGWAVGNAEITLGTTRIFFAQVAYPGTYADGSFAGIFANYQDGTQNPNYSDVHDNTCYDNVPFGYTEGGASSAPMVGIKLRSNRLDDNTTPILLSAAGNTWVEPEFSSAAIAAPGGRLTLTTALPVTTADVTGATTIYYTPYVNDEVWIYNGRSFDPYVFAELSNATAQSSTGKAGPAAVTTNSNYDLFVWNDAGTLRLTRGPLWTSDTGRGTGAGTTQLTLTKGVYLNTVDITNGPAALRGTYVGTVRSDGSSQINDSILLRMVWNAYNRRPRSLRAVDATASWTYSTAAARQANNSTANQVAFVRGLNEDVVEASIVSRFVNSTSTPRQGLVLIGLDSVSADATGDMRASAHASDVINGSPRAELKTYPGLGYHYLTWLEFGAGSDTQTWYGASINGIHGMCHA